MEAPPAKHEVLMQSWQLFKHLTPFRASEIEFSPVFQRERQRSPALWTLTLPPRLAQVSLPAALLIGIAYVVGLIFVPVPLAAYCLSALAVWPILALPSRQSSSASASPGRGTPCASPRWTPRRSCSARRARRCSVSGR